QRGHDPCLVRGTGPGGEQDAVGTQPADFGQRDGVVAVDVTVHVELAQILHQVVDERVVVVDHQHAHLRSRSPVFPKYVAGQGPTRKSPKGSRWSAAGKTQYQSMANTAEASTTIVVILPARLNGSLRHSHPYIGAPNPARRGARQSAVDCDQASRGRSV